MEQVNKGLDGVIADQTAVCDIRPKEKILLYRGFNIRDLVENCSFDEVAYLLLNGSLARETELADFCSRERQHRWLSADLLNFLKNFKGHSLDVLRSAISFIGQQAENVGDLSPENQMEQSFALLAKIPLIIAAHYRFNAGLPLLQPREELDSTRNFFYLCFGKIPEPEIISAFDKVRILYAEHGFNAATFAARITASTEADLFSAAVAAAATLKGPLHGGAIEKLQQMLDEVKCPENVATYVTEALQKKKKIIGFGHRLYKNQTDIRYPLMKRCLLNLCMVRRNAHYLQLIEAFEREMAARKNLFPNLDLAAGPAFRLMGFELEMFVPLIIMSRVVGWCAHIMEQVTHNRIIRPSSQYIGPAERSLL